MKKTFCLLFLLLSRKAFAVRQCENKTAVCDNWKQYLYIDNYLFTVYTINY